MIKRILLTINIIVIIYACSSYNKEKLLKNVNKEYDAGEYKNAINIYSRILERDTCKECLFMRGLSFQVQEEWQDAINDYSEYLTYDTKNWMVYANRASSYYNLKIYSLSLYNFKMAHELKPIFFNQISHMYFATDKKDSACFYYKLSVDYGDTEFNKLLQKYCTENQ